MPPNRINHMHNSELFSITPVIVCFLSSVASSPYLLCPCTLCHGLQVIFHLQYTQNLCAIRSVKSTSKTRINAAIVCALTKSVVCLLNTRHICCRLLLIHLLLSTVCSLRWRRRPPFIFILNCLPSVTRFKLIKTFHKCLKIFSLWRFFPSRSALLHHILLRSAIPIPKLSSNPKTSDRNECRP